MRSPELIETYRWPPSTTELAALAGLDPLEVLRFDGNTPARPSPVARPATVAVALAELNDYDRSRYQPLRERIAARHGLRADQVLLGAGSDELLLLAARTFATGGTIALVPQRTYSLYRYAASMVGAVLVDDPARADLTFVCRPNNPTGELCDLPDAGRLVVDEAYAEYAGVTAIGELDRGVIVLRTFSKAFGLAGARVGYALAAPELIELLESRQAPLSVAAPSAALALAALEHEPDVAPLIEERERLAAGLRDLGLAPLESRASFLYVPVDDPHGLADALALRGLVVRRFDDAIRISVRDEADDDALLAGLADLLGRTPPATASTGGEVRRTRITAETCVRVRLQPRGQRVCVVRTGVGLYDHLFEQLGFHAGLDLRVEAAGDLETGEHHVVEDTALAIGEAIRAAIVRDPRIARYGEARVPMDEAVGHAVLDASGRPRAAVTVVPDPGMARHALESLATAAGLTLQLDATGVDAHHTAEAAFKATGRALGLALRSEGPTTSSTKGVL